MNFIANELDPDDRLVGIGSLAAAQADLDDALLRNPDAISQKFIEMFKEDQEKGMFLLQLAKKMAEADKPADKIAIEVSLLWLGAIDKAISARRTNYGLSEEVGGV